VYAKFRCAPLRIKKALGIFRELITTRTTRVLAFKDPLSGSKIKFSVTYIRYNVALSVNVLVLQCIIMRFFLVRYGIFSSDIFKRTSKTERRHRD